MRRLRNERGQAAGVALTAIAVVGVLGVFLWFMASEKAPQDKTCLTYGGGPTEGAKFQKIVEHGASRTIIGFFDKFYCYPTETERSYIVSQQPAEGDTHYTDIITAPSSDNIPLGVELATYFRLTKDDIQSFHDRIGIKTDAFTDEGWGDMLFEYVRPQIDQAWNRHARQYDAVEAYGDPVVFREIQQEFQAELPIAINDALGDDYFLNFRVVLRNIVIPQGLVAELERNKQSAIAVETKRNEVLQARQEALAIAERRRALEKCGQACVLWEAVQNDKINFWVIPGGTDMTLQAPSP